jgi:transcriptional regulator with XRE-family HTH domain
METNENNLTLSTGRLISFYRKTRDLKQEQLAFELGVAQSKVSDWENDKISPTVEDILNISQVLKVEPSKLLPNQTINFHNEFKDSSVNNGHVNNGPNINHYNGNVDEIKQLFHEMVASLKNIVQK